MPRNSTRRQLKIEHLEQRQVLSTLPTAQEQYMLELINEARTNPAAAAERIEETLDDDTKDTLDFYNVDLGAALNQIASTPKRAPVAWSGDLAQAATDHTSDLIARNVQSHYGPNGEDLGDRLDKVGYDSYSSAAENVFSSARSVDNAMQAFLIDWNNPGQGHRQNIQQMDQGQDDFTDAGLSMKSVPTQNWNPFLGAGDSTATAKRYTVTQVFGRSNDAQPQVLGVVYNDASKNNFYDEGEGIGGAKIRVVNAKTGQEFDATSWASGGYQVDVPSGSYQVYANVNGKDLKPVPITVGTDNVKVDFETSRAQVATTPSTPVVTTPTATVSRPVTLASAPTPKAQTVTATPAAAASTASKTASVAATSTSKSSNDSSDDSSDTPVKSVDLPRNLSLLIRYRAAVSRRFLLANVDPTVRNNAVTSTISNVRFWKA